MKKNFLLLLVPVLGFTTTILVAQNEFTVSLKTFLEGPYVTPVMITGLNSAGLIPLS